MSHVPFRMACYDSCFFLKLYDAYGLVHTCNEQSLLVVYGIVGKQFWQEFVAGVISVCFHGECCQWHEVYAIPFFECGHIVVSQR